MKVGIMALSVGIMWNTKRLPHSLDECGDSLLCMACSSMRKLIISSGVVFACPNHIFPYTTTYIKVVPSYTRKQGYSSKLTSFLVGKNGFYCNICGDGIYNIMSDYNTHLEI